jgi:hypothetical protein
MTLVRAQQCPKREGDWICLQCQNYNFSFRKICRPLTRQPLQGPDQGPEPAATAAARGGGAAVLLVAAVLGARAVLGPGLHLDCHDRGHWRERHRRLLARARQKPVGTPADRQRKAVTSHFHLYLICVAALKETGSSKYIAYLSTDLPAYAADENKRSQKPKYFTV